MWCSYILTLNFVFFNINAVLFLRKKGYGFLLSVQAGNTVVNNKVNNKSKVRVIGHLKEYNKEKVLLDATFWEIFRKTVAFRVALRRRNY